jgi:uncharacterized SAM-binding protein YcdF (DUF218 family)
MKNAQTSSRSRTWTARRIITSLLLAILVWIFVAWVAARALIVKADLAAADAIVVLSGSSTYIERTHKAAELFREGRAPLIVLTNDDRRGGWSSALQTNPYFVERARDELIKENVPPDKISVVPGTVSSTHDEALAIKDYAVSQHLRSLLVVTSAYHSRRALRSLRQSFAGTETLIGLEPVPVGEQTPSPAFWWLRVEGWRSVAGEYVKLAYYWFRYD